MWLNFHQNRRHLIFQGGIIPLLGAYNNRKKLKLWESALFSGKYIRIKCHQNQRYLNFPGGGGGRSPLLRGLHVTCDAHFRTQMSYSSQKSCVKFWFRLVEPFKSYHLNFLGGGGWQKPTIRGLHVTCDAHFRTWPSYSSQKSHVKIWLILVEPFKSYRVHKHFSGGQKLGVCRLIGIGKNRHLFENGIRHRHQQYFADADANSVIHLSASAKKMESAHP